MSPEEIDALRQSLGQAAGAGSRGMLRRPEVARWAQSARFLGLVRPLLPGPVSPVAVRGIYFDKSPAANWLVPWHQDLTLALRERREVSGFGPWSVKDGIPHVQPPVALLEKMITLRLHLDDTDETNGALRVVPGSHVHGRLTAAEIQGMADPPTRNALHRSCWRSAADAAFAPSRLGPVRQQRPPPGAASGIRRFRFARRPGVGGGGREPER